ncbi:MAG: Hsp20/alpha crystallin family protein [Thermomicrobiales bacterium]
MPLRDNDQHVAYRLTFGSLRMTGQTDAWRPALEVYETETALVVRAELAGIDENHLRVVLDNDTLMIQGKRMPDAQRGADAPEQRSYHEMGISYGPFKARLSLPFPVERDGVEANYEHGLLTIVLPRIQRVRMKATRAAAVADGAPDDETTTTTGDLGKDSE